MEWNPQDPRLAYLPTYLDQLNAVKPLIRALSQYRDHIPSRIVSTF